jgi:hypothetical protein
MRFLFLLLAMLWSGLAAAQPRVPCEGAPAEGPTVDSAPQAEVWRDLAWTPPACLGWPPGPAAVLVTFSARFRHDGSADALLARFGAVSKLTSVRYWSVTEKKWQPLFVKAQGAGGDFPLDRLKSGQELRFEQRDNRLPITTQQGLTVRAANEDRLHVEVRNAEAVSLMLVDLAKPGDLRTVHLLAREAAGVWRYDSITRVASAPTLLGGGNDSSWINRANALYRLIAGIPTDLEPPLRRE